MPPETGPPMVRMREVVKRFGDLLVLDRLDLEVGRSEKLAIIGSSGSGKSTILRILMTLERIEGGRVEVDGLDVWQREVDGRRLPADEAHLRRVRRKVGMIFQHFNLFPHMNVLRNLTEAPIHVLGLRREEAEHRARELLDQVGLADKAEAWPAQLSGGQKQRVAIARALAMRPRLMLFDEVTSALDPELVGEVLEVLRKLAHSSAMTMIFVTHEMRFAREITDRIVFVDGGHIVEQGPPEQIFTAPEHERTQAFLKSVLEA